MLVMQCFCGLSLENSRKHPGAAVSHRLIGTPIMICRRLAWIVAVSPRWCPSMSSGSTVKCGISIEATRLAELGKSPCCMSADLESE